jgi:hypothetical protein
MRAAESTSQLLQLGYKFLYLARKAETRKITEKVTGNSFHNNPKV